MTLNLVTIRCGGSIYIGLQVKVVRVLIAFLARLTDTWLRFFKYYQQIIFNWVNENQIKVALFSPTCRIPTRNISLESRPSLTFRSGRFAEII